MSNVVGLKSIVMVFTVLAAAVYVFNRPALAQESICANWNTEHFFQTATLVIVSDCLEAGADPNAMDGDGHTPLHFAARTYGGAEKNAEQALIAEALIEADANVSAGDAEGYRPLHTGALHNNVDVVGVLLAARADVNIQADDGSTPLHFAAFAGQVATADLLIEAGADVNAETNKGEKPLFVAGLWELVTQTKSPKHAEVRDLLRRNGAIE